MFKSNSDTLQSSTSTAKSSWQFFLVVWLIFLGVTTWTAANRPDRLDAPAAPWNVDGVFYDNIAFHLQKGDPFIVDFDAPGWRERYQNANDLEYYAQQYDWVLKFRGSGATTMRSPGYPVTLAAIYRIFGHRYDAARLAGCVFVSLAIAMLLTWSFRQFGILAAVIAAITIALDYSIIDAAGTIASESLATLLVAVSFLLAASAIDRPSGVGGLFGWVLCGISFATLTLTRGNWNLGLLIMFALAALLALPIIRKRFPSVSPQAVVAFLATVIVVAAPWWIRNCNTIGHFQPFGTAGACGMVAAYCDESLENYGQWQPQVFHQNQNAILEELGPQHTDLPVRETQTAQRSMGLAIAWSKANWTKIPRLMLYRSLSHWGWFNPSVPRLMQAANTWLVVIGLLGCCFATGKWRSLFVFVLILDIAIVMLTWEHLGRYAIPIRPLVHIGYGVAIATVFQTVTRRSLASLKKL